jgi:hypothetical protein
MKYPDAELARALASGSTFGYFVTRCPAGAYAETGTTASGSEAGARSAAVFAAAKSR